LFLHVLVTIALVLKCYHREVLGFTSAAKTFESYKYQISLWFGLATQTMWRTSS